MPKPRWPLLTVCAVLAVAVYLQSNAELALPDDPSGAAAALEPAIELSDEPAFRMPPIERFSETVTRPLFMSTRRPPEPGAPTAAAERATTALPALEVSGIVISPRQRLALLARGRSSEVIRASEGELVEGWVVTSILPDRVILEQNGTQQELKLKDKAPRAPDRRKRKRIQERQSQTERRATSPAQRPPESEIIPNPDVSKAAGELIERYGRSALEVAQGQVEWFSRSGDKLGHDSALRVLSAVETTVAKMFPEVSE